MLTPLVLSCSPWSHINEKYMVGGYPSYRSYVRAIRAKDIILEKPREVAVIPHAMVCMNAHIDYYCHLNKIKQNPNPNFTTYYYTEY